MFKKVIICFIIITTLFANLCIMPAAATNPDAYDAVTVTKIMNKTNVFDLKAKSAVLIEAATGNILLEKNSHEKLPLASVTKIMTMLLVMEAVDSGKITLEDIVTASAHASSMGGTQVWLEPGEQFPVKELMYAVAIRSANDAAVALGELIAGSEDAFVELMNERAKALGMNNTNFLDCTGLTDNGHYSSAHDISVMSRELITKHPKIFEFTTQWQRTFREGKGQVGLDNTNKLIRFYPGANGLKTGFTQKAGYCLSATALKNNLQLIAVVMGEPDSNTRFAETRKLLDYGFANFEATQVNNKGEIVQEVEIKKGLNARVNAVYSDDVKLLLKKGEKGKIERTVNVETSVTAPVKAGQKLGEVTYTIDGNEVGKADLVADCDVHKASFMRLFIRMMIEWFSIGRAR